MPHATSRRRPAPRILTFAVALAFTLAASATSASALTLPLPDDLSLMKLVVEMLVSPSEEEESVVSESGAVEPPPSSETDAIDAPELPEPGTVSRTGGTGDDPAGPWPGMKDHQK